MTLGGLLIFRGLCMVDNGRPHGRPDGPDFQLLGGGLDGSIGAFWSWVVGALFIASRRGQDDPDAAAPQPLQLPGTSAMGGGAGPGGVGRGDRRVHPGDELRIIVRAPQIPQGIPIPVLILIVVAVGMSALTKVTKFGRYVFAIGGNPEAAELGGINVRRSPC